MRVAGVRNELSAVARASTPTHGDLRTRLVVVCLVTLALDAVGSALVLWAEENEPATEITNFGDAVFWTTSQLLTVSSSMVNPISTEARLLDIAFEAYAIVVVAALAGSFGAFFHRRGLERRPLEADGRG
jgi:hypothetical protein